MARLASRNSSSCGNAGSVSVVLERLQNSPMSRVLIRSRRTTCTQRITVIWSSFGIREAGFRIFDEIAGRDHFAALGFHPRHRLVIAHIALGQRDNGLQIKIDPAGIDGAADQSDDVLAVEPAESIDRALDRSAGHFQRGRRHGGVRWVRRLGRLPATTAGGAERGVVRRDRTREFLHLR